MMNHKKISLLLIAAICVFTLCSCSSKKKTDSNAERNDAENEKISVVTTIFAPYDFVRQIVGDADVELTMLLDPAAEVHSFEPTSQDIIKIQNCDLFIYVGGENDVWVDDILNTMDHSVKTLKLLDCVELYEEEAKEGMQVNEEQDNGGHEEAEWDEHVWISPKNAMAIVSQMTDALCTIDPANQDTYKVNSERYTSDLNDLKQQFQDVVDHGNRKTLIFADRFPARYFVEEYGLDYYAAFPGCSNDTEASAATVSFLIDQVKSEQIPAVFYIELSNEKMADTVCEATGAKKLLFHCCHNVSKADFEAGETYLSLMRNNVETLREALK